MNTNRQGQVEPQRLGVVERVRRGGDGWRAEFEQLDHMRDSVVMTTLERIRCAGITPTRRALWRMYIERERNGELHA